MKRVIACIDSSPCVNAVAEAAAWVAKQTQRELVLLQVLDYYPASYHLGEISGVIGFESNAMLLKELAELEQKQSELALDYSNNLLKHISELIEKLGGVDICFGGIGINGHVAFNEADPSLTNEEFLAQKTRVLKITKETRTANAIGDFNGALEDMPHYCITIGINEISHARKIRLGCFRNWHRAVVRRAAYGEATSDFPVSLLTSHPDINLKITEFVAALD